MTDTVLAQNLPQVPLSICGRSLRHDIDEVIAMALPGMRLAVVADARTAEVLGNHVASALKGKALGAFLVLEGFPDAAMETVERVRRQSAGADALVAVGGGTINDVCKHASFLDDKPYVVFPTAASMNGYLSANASIAVKGYRKTVAARMPKAVFCDLNVIAQAPARLNRSGLGDSLARPTAQADWLMSHLLLNTPYNDTPFALLRELEPQLLEQARGIATGDVASVELLVRVLLLSGLGMTIAGGSYPASQAEHMVAHAMHMMQGIRLPQTLHGEEIGVTTLAMARLQEKMLRAKPKFSMQAFPAERIEKYFGAHAAQEAKKMYKAKQEAIEQAGLSASVIASRWEEIAATLEQVMLPAAKIEAVLKAADAPMAPQKLGWDMEAYNAAWDCARYLRDRFTFLDFQS